MNVNIDENLVRVVVLDVSGVYAQIYDQGYFDRNTLEGIKKQYSDKELWRVLIIE